MFKPNGRYYLITSAATGWDPNQAKYASSTSIMGPWPPCTTSATARPTTPRRRTSFRSGTQATTYIYAGDRWQDPDLVSSKYIWFPLKFSGTSLVMDGYDEWQLDVTTGHWSGNHGFLPQTAWKLVSATSEETQARTGGHERLRRLPVDDLAHPVHGGARPALTRSRSTWARPPPSPASATCPARTRTTTAS